MFNSKVHYGLLRGQSMFQSYSSHPCVSLLHPSPVNPHPLLLTQHSCPLGVCNDLVSSIWVISRTWAPYLWIYTEEHSSCSAININYE